MRAAAYLAVARVGTGHRAGTRITRLRSDPPLVLRPTNPVGPEPPRRWGLVERMPVRVSLVAGAAGPVGGDDLHLSVDVGPGAALVLRSIAATLILPGPYDRPSRSSVSVQVAEDGVLVWLPGPAIAAKGCRHQTYIHVTLDPGARLLLREEILLGRHAEQPGALRQRLRVCRGSQPLHDQELAVGPGAAGWAGSAVTGGRRAVGSLLVVEPGWQDSPSGAPSSVAGVDTALLPLCGPAMLVTALADDALALRRQLDGGLAKIEASLLATSSTGDRPRSDARLG